MRIDAISIGKNPPHDVNVIIEVAVGGEPIKYEMDKEAGTLVVDRFLYTPMRYPGNYGFVPHTLSEDGDPMRRADRQHPRAGAGRRHERAPNRRAADGRRFRQATRRSSRCRPKLTQRYDKVTITATCRTSRCKQIQHFFEHYKDLEKGKWVKIDDWQDATTAKRYITEAIERAKGH
jgi:inorganic pyrophosphatase